MKRLMVWGAALLVLSFLLVPAGFSKSPAKSAAGEAYSNNDDATNTNAPDAKPDDTTSAAPDTDANATPAAGDPAQAAPQSTGGAKAKADEPAPAFTPLPATTGTLGLFTTETGDTLPKGGFAFSAFGNKFGRMPGSVTILQIGVDASVGITDHLTLFATLDPYQHAHVGCGPELSLAPPNSGRPLYPNTIYHTLGADTLCNSVTPTAAFSPTPGYVQDYPFVGHDGGGLGNMTFGLKYGILSERHGDPISLSVRNDVILATKTELPYLLNNGTQGSSLSDLVSVAISKQWGNALTFTYNAGYEFIREPRSQGIDLFHEPDQFKTGAGFLFFPGKRFEPMMEYTGVVFDIKGLATPDTTFGARDPVDGIWGLRMYITKNLGVDLGYRYMLNLKQLNDRSGFVVKVGTAFWPEKAPPPVNHPPTASCSADKSVVFLGSNDSVAVTATAADPDNDTLTYSWTATSGRVDGTGAQVRWLSAGTTVGSYTVTLHVDDGRGGTASCSADIRVEPRPNRPPTISCTANPSTVFAGERSHITCNASDPDGDSLTYTWRANAGQITGNGPNGDFDTTGLSPGTYTITTRVDDGHGGAADANTIVTVRAVPPPPQASKINECAFGRPLSTRIDNVCKRILDDVALRLQNEPRATAVIIGYSDPKERQSAKIAGERGTNAVKYLGEKGIDASRVSTRTGAGQAGATNNRRIDIIYVPEGATY